MYEYGLSLANIKKVLNGGMAKDRYDGGNGNGNGTLLTPIQTVPPALQEAPKIPVTQGISKPAVPEIKPTNNKDAATTEIVPKTNQSYELGGDPNSDTRRRIVQCRNDLGRVRSLGADFVNDYEDSKNIKTDETGSSMIAKYVMISVAGLLFTWISYTALYFYNNIYKNHKLLNISPENRYNKDMPEYPIVRSSLNIMSINSGLTYTVLLPPLIILLCIGILLMSMMPTSIFHNKVMHIKIVLVLSFIATAVYLPVYITQMKNIKQRAEKIKALEDFVYRNFYIDKEFLRILYNNGRVPSSADSVIKAAADKVLLNTNGKINPAILNANQTVNREKVLKILYTLNMYKFLNSDLIDDIAQKRMYRTECLELFDIRKIALPGNSRVFRVADYMRSDVFGNFDNKTNLNVVFEIVNGDLSMKNPLATSIKNEAEKAMRDTKKKASEINIRLAWDSLYTILKFVVMVVVIITIIMIILSYYGIVTLRQIRQLPCAQLTKNL